MLVVPGQILAGTLLIAILAWTIVIVDVRVIEQPFVAVITQVYIVVTLGDTVIDCVEAPVLQL